MGLTRCIWGNVVPGSRVCVTAAVDGDATVHAKAQCQTSDGGRDAADANDTALTAGWCRTVPEDGACSIIVFVTFGSDTPATVAVRADLEPADGGAAPEPCMHEITGKQGDPEAQVIIIAST
jgi:hypothetical protein